MMATKAPQAEKAVAAQSTEKKVKTKTVKEAAKKASASTPPAAPVKKKRRPSSPPKPPSVVDDLDSPYTAPMDVRPVLGAAYGIGRRHIKDGLTYIFERWTNCQENDEYFLWMNGIMMGQGRVTSATASDSLFYLTIPRSTLLLHFVDNVYGVVRRVGSSTPSNSVPQRILILDSLPGGEGNCDGTYHRGLNFTLSDTVIDSVVAARGVRVTISAWVNMRVNDLPMFYWGHYRYLLPQIQSDQVGRDLTFTIESEFLQASGDGHFVVQFYLYDEVLDESGPCHRWSKPIPVNVSLTDTLLDEPEIDEADPVLLMLEADELHGLPATGSVFIRKNHPQFVAGDHLIWTVEGTTPDGEEVLYSFRLPVVLASYNDLSIPMPLSGH